MGLHHKSQLSTLSRLVAWAALASVLTAGAFPVEAAVAPKIGESSKTVAVEDTSQWPKVVNISGKPLRSAEERSMAAERNGGVYPGEVLVMTAERISAETLLSLLPDLGIDAIIDETNRPLPEQAQSEVKVPYSIFTIHLTDKSNESLYEAVSVIEVLPGVLSASVNTIEHPDQHGWSGVAVPGEVLVATFNPESAEGFLARTSDVEVESIYDIVELVSSHVAPEKRANRPNYSAFHITLIDKSNENVEKALEYYSSVEGVECVSRNSIEKLDSITPNDVDYSLQYGLDIIGAATAWSVTTGSDTIVVGVIDSGIDYNHSEFSGVVNRSLGYCARDDVAGRNADVMDHHGHGTHVAGIIGARGNNGSGVSGVGWKFQLAPINIAKSSSDQHTTAALQIRGITYAKAQGLPIVNMSYSISNVSVVNAIKNYFIIRYDLNFDGTVDISDYNSFINNYYLMGSGDPGWNYARSQSLPAGKYLDYNTDGIIDMVDCVYLYYNAI